MAGDGPTRVGKEEVTWISEQAIPPPIILI